jgi:hypothetical protein
MSFNCLEDVESTIPVSPLHLAVSLMSFPLAFLVPHCPWAHTRMASCDSVLASAFWACGKQAVFWKGGRPRVGKRPEGPKELVEDPCLAPPLGHGDRNVLNYVHWLPAPGLQRSL